MGTVTPLPKLKLAVLCVVLLTESICFTSLNPFVGFFVAELLNWDVEESGYASGFLIGLFMVGQLLSSKFWGAVSDRYGRKIAIVAGCLGAATFTFLFGISTSIYMACAARFFHGLFGGVTPVAKTMIVDLTDKTNQAKGFALVSLTWGVGTLIGPSVGGFLYEPDKSDYISGAFNSEGFFATHPAALPMMVISLYCLFAFFFSIFFLTETNHAAVPLSNLFPEKMRDKVEPLLRWIQPALPSQNAKDVIVVEVTDGDAAPSDNVNQETASVASGHSVKMKSFGYKQAFQIPSVSRVCIVSMLMSAPDVLYAEILPLWSIAKRETGGIAITHEQVALISLINCIPGVGANIVFVWVLSFFEEPAKFWSISQVVYGVTSVIVPTAVYVGAKAFYYTMFWNMVRKIFEAWCWAMLMLAVARVAPEGQVGATYAVQQGVGCIVRSIVPFIGAPLFAFSISKTRPFPFNHFLCFILCLIPLLIAAWMTLKLKLRADEPENDEIDSSVKNNDSFGHSSIAHNSFVGSAKANSLSDDDGNGEGEPSFLKHSFVSLANSFATNPVQGLLQPTIVPTFFLGSEVGVSRLINDDASSRNVSDSDESENADGLTKQDREGVNSEEPKNPRQKKEGRRNRDEEEELPPI